MAGKGGKGLIAAKTAAGMDKEKKQPVTRSSRAGLQVAPLSPPHCFSLGSSLFRLVPCVIRARSWRPRLRGVCALFVLGIAGVDGVVVV